MSLFLLVKLRPFSEHCHCGGSLPALILTLCSHCSCAWCWGCLTTARCCSPPTTSSCSSSGTPVTATRSRRSEAGSTSLARSLSGSLSRSGHNHYQDHCQDHCQGVKISVKFMVKIIVKISVQIIVILAKK